MRAAMLTTVALSLPAATGGQAMQVNVSLSSLSNSRWDWYEYLIRFVLGGSVTVLTGIISSVWGASIGGLFLALPAIFCASATWRSAHGVSGGR